MTVKPSSVRLSYGGKGKAVRRKVGNEIQNICQCWYNVDFSQGCIAQVRVDLLDEIIKNNGQYAPGNLQKYVSQGLSDQRCSYCYSYQNTGNVRPKIVDKNTEKDFIRYFNDSSIEIKPRLIRLGKVTEPGHPYFYEQFMNFLELCKKYNSGIIMPTKMLPFGLEGALETEKYATNNNDAVARLARNIGMKSGKEMAEELKSLKKHTLMYSIGKDDMEYGACSQGFTNEWRIKQALEYFKQDVNTSLTIVCDVYQSIEENSARGFAVQQALEARKNYGINIRILPIRPRKDKDIQNILGKSRKEVVFNEKELRKYEKELDYILASPMLFKHEHALKLEELREKIEDMNHRPFRQRGNHELIPRIMHNDFKDLRERGFGFCGEAEAMEHCDFCNLSCKKISFPASEIIPGDYTGKGSWITDKKRRKKDKLEPYFPNFKAQK